MKKQLLFFCLFGTIVLINGCQKEYSFESGSTPSEGTLQDDGAGDCLPKTVSGAYVVGTALVGTTNYIEVQVDVIKSGSYSIFTDTVNGIYFRITGIFTTAGLNTVQLKGFGTPVAAGISNFIVSYGSTQCSIAVTTSGTLGAFTLDGAPGGCMGAVLSGTYTAGTALTAANTVTINVNVTALGAYSISSTLSNGITFTGSGIFTTTGAQPVVLTGTGTPAASGSTNIPVVSGTSSCNFNIDVLGSPTAATFTVDCTSAVINGTYTQNTALAAANTITIGVNVTATGTYTVSTTATNGMTFSASGTFAATGAQTVTLAGTGTPTVAGANTIPVTNGTASCNVTVNVNPAASGAAVFTVDCSTAQLNGYLTKGVPIAPVNTITIDVNVTTPGTYTITTTPINNISYTATGNFAATGITTVTLNGSGNPTNSGTFTLNIPGGNPACGFDVLVDPNMGTWTFKVGATTYSGTIYDAGFDNTQLTPPSIIFYLLGDDAAGNLFEIDLGDLNGTVANAETYKCAPPVTGNAALMAYEGIDGTTYDADPSNPAFAANTITVTVTTHNTTTKTITGTFTGNAILNGGPALANITNGAFTVTYP